MSTPIELPLCPVCGGVGIVAPVKVGEATRWRFRCDNDECEFSRIVPTCRSISQARRAWIATVKKYKTIRI